MKKKKKALGRKSRNKMIHEQREGDQRSRKASMMSNNQGAQAAYPAPPYHSKNKNHLTSPTSQSIYQSCHPPPTHHQPQTNKNKCLPHGPSSSSSSPQPSISSSSPSSSGPSPPTKAQEFGFGGLLRWRSLCCFRACFVSFLTPPTPAFIEAVGAPRWPRCTDLIYLLRSLCSTHGADRDNSHREVVLES